MNNVELLKKKIMNDKDFIIKCRSYTGVRPDKFTIYQKNEYDPITIVLDTPIKDVFIMMDENYNTIGIHRAGLNLNDRSIDDAIYGYRAIYEGIYLFYNYRICDIMNIANRVMISSTIYGHSLRMIVNGEEVNMENENVYIELLSYFKFLGDEIEEYYKKLYQARILGLDFPSVTSYTMSLIRNIDKCIASKIENNIRPWPIDIIANIGENNNCLDHFNNALYEIINLLLREKGYVIGHGESFNKLEQLGDKKYSLLEKSDDLFAILEVPNEVVKNRLSEASKTYHFNNVNLAEFLSKEDVKKIKK